ncbi:hypothetical protein [Levilactobacillus brevis]|uniref:hypothetical protein n=1 Tax=Levilactobacillus brevis TaxID=1580 RepID=UPI000A89681C|nr:hypothetical protein [Levilactobacillus brevis]
MTTDNIQLKADNEALKTGNEELKSANELTQQGLMEAVDYLSSQLTPASTTTGTDSTATSSAAPASSASESSNAMEYSALAQIYAQAIIDGTRTIEAVPVRFGLIHKPF